ncbi:hypothetical protein Ciccas_003348 [Cichlidogyrus casuarinus]|uniref:RNA helicase n=1 Tax=Cichlidogyrus casuarinus TaxID=1844966 RepID=A0ABD2QGX6_9PLAT
MSFKKLGVCKEIIKILLDKGISKPTEVQSGCIPSILSGQDVVACAKTGSGKTATFLIPIIQSLMQELVPMYALVLSPTRELAHQIAEQAAGLNLVNGNSICTVETITGGRDLVRQGLQLARGPHIVIATPGRLADLLRTKLAQDECEEVEDVEKNPEWTLARTKILVMDEADRLLEDAFGDDLSLIVSTLSKNRQTLLFSATLTDAVHTACQNVIELAEKNQTRPPLIWQPAKKCETDTSSGVTVETLSEYYVLMRAEHKDTFLVHILNQYLEEHPHSLIIVFTNKCKWCHLLGFILKKVGINSVLLHSAMKQKDRIASLNSFKSSQARVLIATDLASRGLDIPTVDAVINHHVPLYPKEYVHRVGRTARAGKSGIAITLADMYEIDRLEEIQRFIGKKMAKYETDDKQVAKIIAEVTIARRDAERHLDSIRFDEKQDIEKAKRILKSGNNKAKDDSSTPRHKKSKTSDLSIQ